jgi:serine/threonine protein kinase
MVSYEGNVKIVDFGIAKAVGRTVVTRTGTVRGKIGYLSPEQCRGVPVDRRCDVFSLGIVMWEMLTGEPLYRRATDLETMTAIVADRPPPPSTLRAEVPRDVDDIVLRMLAQPVTQRFQTARAVVEAIELASMRAGTLLSTSAVSSLVRDLFGERVEPWRELDRATPPLVRVTLSSPLTEPGAPPPEPADLAALPVVTLSSAIDLFDDASSEPRDASGAERAGALDSATLVDPAPAVSTAATTVRAVRSPAMTRGRTGTTRVQRFATEVASSFTLPLLVMMILAAVLAAIGTWLVI